VATLKASERITPEELEALQGHLDRAARASVRADAGEPGADREVFEAHRAFSDGILRASRMRRLIGLIQTFNEYLERFVTEVKPQLISYDDYMVQYSMDLENPGRASRYFIDLLEVRGVARKYGLPFWNIVSSNQIRAHTTIPSPANLAMQAYTTLAAGGRGVTWYTYNARGYGYAPIDKHGNRTMTWQYLQMVNRQVKTLGPIMNGMRSTGVYFTSPAPAESAPLLPGEVVRGLKTDVPMMLGEFIAHDGARWAMVVNLSLQKSAKVALDLQEGYQQGTVISPEDGSELGMEEGNAVWLAAGQGALIKVR